MQGRWGDGVLREQALTWMAEALEQLGPRAQAHGVPVLLEPLNRYESNLFNRVADSLEFLKSLRTRDVKLLCDLFHMNIEEKNQGQAIRKAGKLLGHFHACGSDRGTPGNDHIDW